MAIVHTTGNFPELLYPGLAEIWGLNYKAYDPKYPKFFDIKTSDKAFEKEQGITEFTVAGVKNQGDSVPYAEFYQGYQKEYLHVTYGIGAVITKEMVEDDQYGVIKQVPKLLAISLRETEEIVATNVLNNAFNATAQTIADGGALISATHANVAGGTQSNQPTVASDLTQTSLEQAIIDVMNFRDEQNKRKNFQIKTLVVPRQLYFTATKILETQYATGSADNDVNVLSNMGIELCTTTYLTDPDAWYVITDAPSGLTFYRRRPAEVGRDNDFDTDNLKIKTTTRFSVGATDWRRIYGSAGA